jgi:hypothetical protein
MIDPDAAATLVPAIIKVRSFIRASLFMGLVQCAALAAEVRQRARSIFLELSVAEHMNGWAPIWAALIDGARIKRFLRPSHKTLSAP